MEQYRQAVSKYITEGPIFFTIFLLHFILGLFPTQEMVFVVWGSLIFFSLLKPAYGIVGWVMLLPLEQYVTQQTGVSPFIGHTLILLAGVLWDGFRIKKFRIKIEKSKATLWGAGLLLIPAALAGYNAMDNIRGLISVGLLVCIFLAVVYHIGQKQLPVIILSLVGSSLLGLLISIIGFENTWRITIDGNVRVLSNAIGLSMVFAFAVLLGDRVTERLPEDSGKKLKTLAAVGTVFFGLILITTVSRGAILAVGLSAFSMIFLKFISVKNKKESIKKGLYSIPVIGIFIVAVNFIERHFTSGHLARRLNLEMFDNIRFEIWGAALNQLSPLQWLIGTGPDNFRQLANQGGYDYYAHSVFVDTLVSFGVIGLGLLALVLAVCLLNHILHKNILAVGTTVYLFLSFATHGSLNSKFFWLTLAVVYGSFYLDKTDLHHKLINKFFVYQTEQ